MLLNERQSILHGSLVGAFDQSRDRLFRDRP